MEECYPTPPSYIPCMWHGDESAGYGFCFYGDEEPDYGGEDEDENENASSVCGSMMDGAMCYGVPGCGWDDMTSMCITECHLFYSEYECPIGGICIWDGASSSCLTYSEA